MIPNPLIYNQNEGQISNDLLPIHRRKPIFLAWFKTLLQPLQWEHDLIFNDYANGVTYPLWVTATPYTYGTRIQYIDNAIYELQNVAGLTSSVPPNLDTTNWTKILDSFIGVRERARYNGTKLLLEYALNRYFMVTPFSTIEWGVLWVAGHPVAQTTPPYTQIYISNVAHSISNFWLSDGGAGSLTSYMNTNSIFQRYFIGNAYATYSPYSFTIYVPTAVYAQIQANQVVAGVTAEDVIRAFADKYVQAGKLYQIIQY